MTRGLLTPGTCFQKGGQKYTGEREGPQSYLRGASICRASENSWNPKGHSTLIRGARLGDQLCPSSASNPEQVVTASDQTEARQTHPVRLDAATQTRPPAGAQRRRQMDVGGRTRLGWGLRARRGTGRHRMLSLEGLAAAAWGSGMKMGGGSGAPRSAQASTAPM